MTFLSQTNSVFRRIKLRLTLSPIQQQSTLGNNLPDHWRTASTEAQTHYVRFCAWSYSLAHSWWYLVFCKKTAEGNKDLLFHADLSFPAEVIIMFRCHQASSIKLCLTHAAYEACALILISTSLLTSAWMRCPCAGVGCTNWGKYSPSWHEGAGGSTGVQLE